MIKRFDLSLSIGNIANDMIETAKNFIAQNIYIPSSKIEQIKNGHAGIVEYNDEKIGVYKNNDGKEKTLNFVSQAIMKMIVF